MMKKKVCTIMLLLALDTPCWGQEAEKQGEKQRVFQGCSGGMMLHTGYLGGVNSNAPMSASGTLCSPQGATFGIGGSMRVNLWKYLRLGCEGFVSTMYKSTTDCSSLLQDGSYVRMAWGGLIADCCWRNKKIWPYLGVGIGGGAMRSLYIMEGSEYDWQREENVVFHKQGFVYVDPYVGMDYCVTERFHLSFRADWVIALHEGNLIKPTGPRLYIGFLFCH